MWKNVSKLWDNNNNNYRPVTTDELNNLLNVVPKSSSNHESTNLESSIILTDTSPRFQAKECPIKLWPHQEAMLHRIRQIENQGYKCYTESKSAIRYMDKSLVNNNINVILGVMNDPPGSGKTYAILTQILIDTNPGATIIIVPQNIYGQWRQATEMIFKHQISTCKFISMYADIIDIYGQPQKVNSYKVVLLQDNFAEAYLKTLNDKKNRSLSYYY